MAAMPSARATTGSLSLDDAAVDLERPGVRPVGAGDDLDERRFAGAVLADEGVDLAGGQVERDALKRLHAAEGFGDVGQTKKRLHPRTSADEMSDLVSTRVY